MDLRDLTPGEWRRVLRLAARLQAEDRARQMAAELRDEYLRAAGEAGLTEAYVQRAAEEVRGRRTHVFPRPAVAVALALGLASVLWGALFGVWALRTAPAPMQVAAPVVVETMAPPPPAPTPPPALPIAQTPARTLPDGLGITVLREGAGPRAVKGQEVRVHYTGWLATTGEKFDSSLDRGEPFAFELGAGHCIRGWEEGVLGMRCGEKRQLVIPAELGYGSAGAPGAIPGGATLIFQVELTEICAPGSGG